ncbi:MAG: hypothetical protein JWM20_314 [Patescibacteria group bacterium]|nr:hypothetical protein [Patescibacteria group bacterium]
MKITYDKSVDALNLTIRAGKVARTISVSDGVMLDVDKKGDALHLEILNASSILGKNKKPEITLGKKAFPIPEFA